MNRIFCCFSFLILFFGCSEPKEIAIEEFVETPSALTTTSRSTSLLKSASYRQSIVAKLYDEALEKDPALKQIDTDINRLISGRYGDNLDEYTKYKSLNDEYWLDMVNYISGINDSLTRQSTLLHYQGLHQKFKERVQVHEQTLDTVSALESKLEDQARLLKLAVSQSMMSNYQKNELVDIEVLKDLIKAYEAQVRETEAYRQSIE